MRQKCNYFAITRLFKMSASDEERSVENTVSDSHNNERTYYCYKCDREFTLNETVIFVSKVLIDEIEFNLYIL